MRLEVHEDAEEATLAAADALAAVLASPATRAVMVAGGNTPLRLYAEIARRRLALGHLDLFVLDEYVGVPAAAPRTCSNLLRRAVQEAWGIAPERFHALSPCEEDALEVLRAHERNLEALGGLDAVVLGLGRNGHVGFNEPGSAPGSGARLVDLAPASVEANRAWFGGEHAPARGATTGLVTILAARRALLLAFGEAKAEAVRAMVEGPKAASCPASWLQGHPGATIYIDDAAAARLTEPARRAGRSSPRPRAGGPSPPA